MRNVIFFSFFLLAGCISEIDFAVENSDTAIVVNSLFTQGRMVIYLNQPVSINGDGSKFIDDALVVIVKNDVLDTLQWVAPGKYESRIEINELETEIFLKVTVPGTGLVYSSSYVPLKPQWTNASYRFPAGYDRYGDPYREVALQINDDGDKENFYELYFFIPFNNKVYYLVNEFVVESDPVLLAEGLEGFDNTSFLFSDKLFNGENYSFRLKFELSSAEGEGISSHIGLVNNAYYVAIRSVSKQYYDFRKSWISHRYHQQSKPAIVSSDALLSDYVNFLFKGDVQTLYSNIDGGYGIFSGYNESIIKLEEIDD